MNKPYDEYQWLVVCRSSRHQKTDTFIIVLIKLLKQTVYHTVKLVS